MDRRSAARARADSPRGSFLARGLTNRQGAEFPPLTPAPRQASPQPQPGEKAGAQTEGEDRPPGPLHGITNVESFTARGFQPAEARRQQESVKRGDEQGAKNLVPDETKPGKPAAHVLIEQPVAPPFSGPPVRVTQNSLSRRLAAGDSTNPRRFRGVASWAVSGPSVID